MRLPIEELSSEKIYGFASIKKLSDNEKETISEIVNSSMPNFSVKSVDFLETTENYDSYKISDSKKTIELKLSFEEDCPSLKYESRILDNDLQITPKYYGFGEYNQLSYLISSYENAPNIGEIGWDSKMQDSFFTTLKSFNKFDFKHAKTLNKFLREETEIFGQYWTEEKKVLAEKDENFHFLTEFHRTAMEGIQSCVVQMPKETNICHGKLNRENVLTRGGLFKFIDMSGVHKGHALEDAVNFAYSINMSPTNFDDFIIHYAVLNKQQNMIEGIVKMVGYTRCANLIQKYFNQIYLLGFSQPKSLLEDGVTLLNSTEIYTRFLPVKQLNKTFKIFSKMMGVA